MLAIFCGWGFAHSRQAAQVWTICGIRARALSESPALLSSLIMLAAEACHHLKSSFRNEVLVCSKLPMRSVRRTRPISNFDQSSGSAVPSPPKVDDQPSFTLGITRLVLLGCSLRCCMGIGSEPSCIGSLLEDGPEELLAAPSARLSNSISPSNPKSLPPGAPRLPDSRSALPLVAGSRG